MGSKALNPEEYKRLKAKIDAGETLTKEELHAFSEDYMRRREAATDLAVKYATSRKSFQRIGFSFMDVNELEEFNPDPVSREEARQRNIAEGERISKLENRVEILFEYYNKMLNTNIEDLFFKSNEDALKFTINNPQDCLLGFDPSPMTTTSTGDTEPTREMIKLFDQFNAVMQNQGNGVAYMEAASQDVYTKVPDLKSRKQFDVMGEVMPLMTQYDPN